MHTAVRRSFTGTAHACNASLEKIAVCVQGYCAVQAKVDPGAIARMNCGPSQLHGMKWNKRKAVTHS